MASSISKRYQNSVKKIVNLENIDIIPLYAKKLHKKIVLTGGCFDILHSGHLYFLSESKKNGDILIILLESDENIKIRKGKNRPINSMKKRLKVLSLLSYVDFIIPLRGMTKKEEYDKLIVQIKPDLITITKGDINIKKRKIQADLVGAKLIEISKIENISTTQIIKNIK